MNRLLIPGSDDRGLIRSKRRVADHGEVFTPGWLVKDMLGLVGAEAERAGARVLEPACGSGNFLVPLLQRKLAEVERRYRAGDPERRHHALFALMCVYGIELLEDNAAECRRNLVGAFSARNGYDPSGVWMRAARAVAAVNVVQGDALEMRTAAGKPIVLPEWAYLGQGGYRRRDFRLEDLAGRAPARTADHTSFSAFAGNSTILPVRTHPPLSVRAIAA